MAMTPYSLKSKRGQSPDCSLDGGGVGKHLPPPSPHQGVRGGTGFLPPPLQALTTARWRMEEVIVQIEMCKQWGTGGGGGQHSHHYSFI